MAENQNLEVVNGHVVVPFRHQNPELFLQDITLLRNVITSDRNGADVYVRFNIRVGRRHTRLYLHVQPDDLYVRRFHINDNYQQPWSLDAGSSTRNLGIGHRYINFAGDRGVLNVQVGLMRFDIALIDIINRFTDDGSDVSLQRQRNLDGWNRQLGLGVASVVVIVIESCRFTWISLDYNTMLNEQPHTIRYVTPAEGELVNSWEHVSSRSRLNLTAFRHILRSIPISEDDVRNARGNPVHARDSIAIRTLIRD